MEILKHWLGIVVINTNLNDSDFISLVRVSLENRESLPSSTDGQLSATRYYSGLHPDFDEIEVGVEPPRYEALDMPNGIRFTRLK